jgi:hypothetical protein
VLTIELEKKLCRTPQCRMDEMKPKNILYTTFILFIFTLLAGCSSSVDQQVAAKPLFPEQHGWDLKQVSISDADSTLDFKRVDCVWVIGNDNKPSNEPKVTTLAEKLVTMAPRDVLAIKRDRYNDFKVGDNNFTRKVVLTFKDKSSYTLLIGTPAITKPAYVRLADKNQVYMVDEPLFRQINLDASSWLAPEEG